MRPEMTLFKDMDSPTLVGRYDIEVAKIPETGAKPDPGFVQSIKTFGVLADILLVLDDSGSILLPSGQRARLFDGLRRVEGSRLAGKAVISAKVFDIEPNYADTATVALNAKRSTNPVAELQAVERVMKQAIGEREISKATGIEIAYLRKLLNLRMLIPGLRELFDGYQLKWSVAEQAAKLKEDKQEQLLLQYKNTGNLLGKHVSALKDGQKREASGKLEGLSEVSGSIDGLKIAEMLSEKESEYQTNEEVKNEDYIPWMTAGIIDLLRTSGISVTVPAECERWLRIGSPDMSPQSGGEMKYYSHPESSCVFMDTHPGNTLGVEEISKEEYDRLSEEYAKMELAEENEEPLAPPAEPEDESDVPEEEKSAEWKAMVAVLARATDNNLAAAKALADFLINEGIACVADLGARTGYGLMLHNITQATVQKMLEAQIIEGPFAPGYAVNGYPETGVLVGGDGEYNITKLVKGKTGGLHLVSVATGEVMFVKWADIRPRFILK